MTDTAHVIELALLKADVAHLREEVADLRVELRESNVIVRELRDLLIATRGGWRVLATLCGAATVLIGVAATIYKLMGGR